MPTKETSVKIPFFMGVQRASRLVNTLWCWDGGGPGEGTAGLQVRFPSPNALLYASHPSPLTVHELYPFMINLQSSK